MAVILSLYLYLPPQHQHKRIASFDKFLHMTQQLEISSVKEVSAISRFNKDLLQTQSLPSLQYFTSQYLKVVLLDAEQRQCFFALILGTVDYDILLVVGDGVYDRC